MNGELRAREKDAQKYIFYLYRSAPLISALVVAWLDCSEDFRAKISGLAACGVVAEHHYALRVRSPCIDLLNVTLSLKPTRSYSTPKTYTVTGTQ
jgi:hypothetical protein